MNIDYDELQEVGFYEYVSRHYWEMSKEQLVQFVKELAYSAENLVEDYRSIEKDAISELEDFGV